jgi:hypothetical protein
MGASFNMAISFGTIVGATNLPEFSKTRCTGAALMIGAAAGGGGGGGGGATRNVDANCLKSSESVKYSPATMGATKRLTLTVKLINVSTSRELLFIRLYSKSRIGTNPLPTARAAPL